MKSKSSEKISKIRERGQLTIPSQIRRALDWSTSEIAVKVEPIRSEDAQDQANSPPSRKNQKTFIRSWMEKNLEEYAKSKQDGPSGCKSY